MGNHVLEIKKSNYLDIDVQAEIEEFKNNSFVFNGFLDFDNLYFDDLELLCTKKLMQIGR